MSNGYFLYTCKDCGRNYSRPKDRKRIAPTACVECEEKRMDEKRVVIAGQESLLRFL